ncbi:MAG: hypothetical protein KGD63_14405 [Candidatus Lokiarchaeota archaeon]|nr:hypothetical protein [Candidatus Lokiarchaeota archaeon]
MEDKWSKILSKIEDIEEKNAELIDFLSKLPFLSREAMMENILKDIITNHPIFKTLGITEKKVYSDSKSEKAQIIKQYIGDTILIIDKNPAKKVFFLKKFLDNFVSISESDKNIVLQSLKNTEIKDLENKMSSLISIFEINNIE